MRDTNELHAQDLKFIEAELRAATAAKQRAVVLTHHAPLMRGTSDPIFDSPQLPAAATAASDTTKAPALSPTASMIVEAVAPSFVAPPAAVDSKSGSAAAASAPALSPAPIPSEANALAHAFASPLQYFFDHTHNPQYKALCGWVFGHSHYCVDRTVNGIPLVANQRGYEPKEVAKEYRPDCVLTIPAIATAAAK